MHPLLSRLVVGAGLLSAGVVASVAQPSFAGEAEVANLRFNTLRQAGGWYEVEVEVAVRAAPDNASRFVNRVRVGLNLGFELSLGERRFEFYRAEVTAVTLEQGRATFRFYLPPEVVKRDRISGDAKFYHVELVVGETAMPPSRANVSPSLPNPEALQSFLVRVRGEGAVNDGVLVPQHLSPFHARTAPGDGPAVLRREPRR